MEQSMNFIFKLLAPCRPLQLVIAALVLILASCSAPKQKKEDQSLEIITAPVIPSPSFNPDSAFKFTSEQVAFGPRIPGTPAHKKCAAYLVQKLESFDWNVQVQKGVVQTYDKKKFELANIIAQYQPSRPVRYLLCAHWDTRPFADRDTLNPDKPFDGANDGASSTAVLLEIARQISMHHPDIGVDIILFDIEDYGDKSGKVSDSWCLGSQYWSKNPHQPGYFARFGILLDMVGARNAVFPKEGTSLRYAPAIVNKVWTIAREKGFSRYFIESSIQETIDDHLYVNQLANIPCIDIVHYDVNTMDYMPCHHRHCDNMDIIDPETLFAVGQVVLEVLYSELNSVK